jgi:hypothetical protein
MTDRRNVMTDLLPVAREVLDLISSQKSLRYLPGSYFLLRVRPPSLRLLLHAFPASYAVLRADLGYSLVLGKDALGLRRTLPWRKSPATTMS